MKKETWVETFYFNRGHVLVLNYDTANEAKDAISVAVFGNRDCVNFSCYLKITEND